MSKVWFITGAGRGFGRHWAEAALEQGDKVVGTARSTELLKDLSEKYPDQFLALSLDVTIQEQAFDVVKAAHQHFGQIDVVINNAGYGYVSAVEEANLEDVKQLFETNVYGSLSVIQAVLPIMREQKNGHIIQISSSVGIYTLPLIGLYSASKFAVEGMVDALSQEVSQFGIKVTLVEPGAYATNFSTQSSLKFAQPNDVYQVFRDLMNNVQDPDFFGDPLATSKAILKLVDMEQPPLRLILGDNFSTVSEVYKNRLQVWEEWEDLAKSAKRN